MIDVEASIEKAWKDIAKAVSGANPAVRVILRDSEHVVDGSSIKLKLKGGFASILYGQYNVTELIQEALYRIVRVWCTVK